MKKQYISVILVFSMIITLFSGCNNIKNTQNTQAPPIFDTNLPYYSVTTAYSNTEKNPYMELDIKIPKIAYSNEENDSLFDPINEEMMTNITNLVEEAKVNAMDTYNMYLITAKNNIKTEKENKIIALKNKYESLIGDDELEAITQVMNEPIVATNSFVVGFTNSEQLIIQPELHNKNIIIVDQTKSSDIAQTTISINGKPGRDKEIIPPDIMNNDSVEIAATPSFINSDKKEKFNNKQSDNQQFKDKSFTNHQIKDKNSNINNSNDIINDLSTPSTIENNFEELTLDNFYKELNMIKQIKIPNNHKLTREYIPTYIYCGFDVKCLDEDYLSLYIELSETRINTSSKRFYYNIDLKNKKIININDVLGDNYKENCISTINAAIENWPEEKKSDLFKDYKLDNFINEQTSFFINNNHIPVVVLEKNTIIPSAAGYPEFQVVKK